MILGNKVITSTVLEVENIYSEFNNIKLFPRTMV